MSFDIDTLLQRLILALQKRKMTEEDRDALKAIVGEDAAATLSREEMIRLLKQKAAMGGHVGGLQQLQEPPEEDEEAEDKETDDDETDAEPESTSRKIALNLDDTPEDESGFGIEFEYGDGEGAEEEDEEEIDLKYPLIPRNPKPDENVYAWAHVTYDPNKDEIVYRVNEPDLSRENEDILEKLEDRLKEKIDVDFGAMKRDEAKDFLMEKTSEILDGREFDLSEEDEDIITYYAYRNFVGLGKIEPLMQDPFIEDISCDGVGVPIYVYHRNPQVNSVPTNVVFEDNEAGDSFVRKLAQRCGRSISTANPLLDGSLPDGSRVQATLSTDVARRGSNFTIRRFTEEPLTPMDIMKYGTIDPKMMAYLWMAIENGKSMLVSGPTASGKTSLLNALSLFIPPELKIVSIEDTPELRLPHPNWVPEVSRSGFGFGESDSGQVTLDDLLKESLRQRPDYIIVGEVRGEEAYILFQQIATGHPGLSTIHASSIEKVMDRLTTRPIELPPSLIENLDVIIFIKRIRRRGEYIRRIEAIYELEGFDRDADRPIFNKLFEWNANTDTFETLNDSSVLADISKERGISREDIQSEIKRRKQIIQWMADQGIDHYTEVGRIASLYHRHPKQFLKRIGGS